MGTIIWVAAGQVLLPILAGALFVALSPRMPFVIRHTLIASVGLFYGLVILTALAAPGGDLWMPAIGGCVSLGVAIVAFVTLRRRKIVGAGADTRLA
jgi:uncharacterized membrane protein